MQRLQYVFYYLLSLKNIMDVTGRARQSHDAKNYPGSALNPPIMKFLNLPLQVYYEILVTL